MANSSVLLYLVPPLVLPDSFLSPTNTNSLLPHHQQPISLPTTNSLFLSPFACYLVCSSSRLKTSFKMTSLPSFLPFSFSLPNYAFLFYS